MSETKLLACPFCGNTRVRVDALLGDDWFVSCEKNSVAARGCGMSLYAIHPTRELAIAAWNTRVPDPRIEAAQEMADALKAFREAWDKSHQLEKTDIARRLAETALEAWEKLQ